jgi:hypothetical protein
VFLFYHRPLSSSIFIFAAGAFHFVGEFWNTWQGVQNLFWTSGKSGVQSGINSALLQFCTKRNKFRTPSILPQN